ncbi:MAG: flagellar biosynthesis protein FlgJ [Rhizobiaceae bacterium]|nr:MAG: flagellar biosynthesis protein FlgJ [Rhizobiaceae bacterium]
MAISPPGDIVLDVARAAGPEGIETARAALEKRAQSGIAAAPFEPAGPAAPQAFNATAASPRAPANKAYQRFEAVVLQTFLQSMMPKNSEAVYGSGLAGDMWKSELAQQVATVMAKHGGIGIANRLLKAHYVVDGKNVALTGAWDGAAKAEQDTRHLVTRAVIDEMQRKLTTPIAAAPSDETKI